MTNKTKHSWNFNVKIRLQTALRFVLIATKLRNSTFFPLKTVTTSTFHCCITNFLHISPFSEPWALNPPTLQLFKLDSPSSCIIISHVKLATSSRRLNLIIQIFWENFSQRDYCENIKFNLVWWEHQQMETCSCSSSSLPLFFVPSHPLASHRTETTGKTNIQKKEWESFLSAESLISFRGKSTWKF